MAVRARRDVAHRRARAAPTARRGRAAGIQWVPFHDAARARVRRGAFDGGPSGRRVVARAAHRPGGHGNGLAGASGRRPIRRERSRQVAQRFAPRPRGRGAIPARGKPPRPAVAPQRGAAARRRPRRRGAAVSRTRVRRGRAHRSMVRRTRARCAFAPATLPPAARGRRSRPRQPRGAPGHQAVEHPRHPRGHGQAARLRHRAVLGERRDGRANEARIHSRVRVAGTARRIAGLDRLRRVLVRCPALPPAHRPAPHRRRRAVGGRPTPGRRRRRAAARQRGGSRAR